MVSDMPLSYIDELSALVLSHTGYGYGHGYSHGYYRYGYMDVDTDGDGIPDNVSYYFPL